MADDDIRAAAIATPIQNSTTTRSGDSVQMVSVIANLVMTVLAPFVAYWIGQVQKGMPGLELPKGYDYTVLLLIATMVNQGAQFLRMVYIRRRDLAAARLARLSAGGVDLERLNELSDGAIAALRARGILGDLASTKPSERA